MFYHCAIAKGSRKTVFVYIFIFWIDVTLLERNPKRMGLFGKEKGKDPKEMVNVWIKLSKKSVIDYQKHLPEFSQMFYEQLCNVNVKLHLRQELNL